MSFGISKRLQFVNNLPGNDNRYFVINKDKGFFDTFWLLKVDGIYQ